MKVTIATPMYGGMCTSGYTSSMINLFKKAAKVEGLELEFMYGVNEALVTRARNMCANIFMKSDSTHLLFIDSDIEFNADELIRMMLTNKDFVCGVYPKKNLNWDRISDAVRNGVPPDMIQRATAEYLFIGSGDMTPDVDGLVKIDRVGTGMMMFSKKVLETLNSHVKSFALESPVLSNVKFGEKEEYKEYFFTSTDPVTNIFLHEDFTFCKLWRDIGGDIYGAPWVYLRHIGNHTFG
jgi:hypothetical protein